MEWYFYLRKYYKKNIKFELNGSFLNINGSSSVGPRFFTEVDEVFGIFDATPNLGRIPLRWPPAAKTHFSCSYGSNRSFHVVFFPRFSTFQFLKITKK